MAAAPQGSSTALGNVNWDVALDRLINAFITSEASSTSKWNKLDPVVRPSLQQSAPHLGSFELQTGSDFSCPLSSF